MTSAAPGRLLMLGNFLSAGGGSRSPSEDIADYLESRRWGVVRASHHRPGPLRAAHMLTAAVANLTRIDAATIDLYSGRAFRWAEAAAGILRLAGKPFSLSLRGGNLPVMAEREPERVARLLRSASEVVAVSDYLRAELAHVRSRIELIPNSVATDRFAFRHRERPQPRIVWLRSLHHMYRPDLAVEIAARLRPEFPDLTLEIVGPDRGDGSLAVTRGAITRLGMEQAVTLTGAVPHDQTPRTLDRADIFLNTTTIDNTPMSVLEAMACGLCVVSTDAGGCKYLLRHELDALLAPVNDAAALAGCVSRILREPGLASRLSLEARRAADERSWERVAPRWERFFLDLCSRSEEKSLKK